MAALADVCSVVESLSLTSNNACNNEVCSTSTSDRIHRSQGCRMLTEAGFAHCSRVDDEASHDEQCLLLPSSMQ